MSLFEKRTQVYGPEKVTVGEFDASVDGCYRNVFVKTLPVRPRRMLYVSVDSDAPVDVAVANEDNSAAGHRDRMTKGTLGPFSTRDFSTMGLFVGVYRGDKAEVMIEAWIEKERSPYVVAHGVHVLSAGAVQAFDYRHEDGSRRHARGLVEPDDLRLVLLPLRKCPTH